eukprot:4520607-Amphidinium_carterae.1
MHASRAYRLSGAAEEGLSFDDLERLEAAVVERTLLLSKPLLQERLPGVLYTDEMVQSSVLSELEERVGLQQELMLPASADSVLGALLKQDPANHELVKDFALVVAAMAVQGNVRMDQSLVDFCQGVAGGLLRPRQRRAAAILRRDPHLDGLRLSHLRALNAACWSGKVDAQFTQPLTEQEAAQLSAALSKVPDLSELQAALQRVGAEQFSYSRGWKEYIENAEGEKIRNPRLVCPAGSLYYSAIEPMLLGIWSNIPDEFMWVPITCFEAALARLGSTSADGESLLDAAFTASSLARPDSVDSWSL